MSDNITSGIVNADNRDLQPGEGGMVGDVDKVNGPGAAEVPEFTPTKAELLALVKYWENILLDSQYFIFSCHHDLRLEMTLIPYAVRRLDRIVGLLGDDAVKAVDEVKNEFAKSGGFSDWADYCGHHARRHQ
jgi:hypothetical protein